jgi:hypothetical protein
MQKGDLEKSPLYNLIFQCAAGLLTTGGNGETQALRLLRHVVKPA